MNQNNYREVFGVGKWITLIKRCIYAIFRPLQHRAIKRKLAHLNGDYAYDHVDVFVKSDGGMFKSYALGVCNSLLPMKDKTVLVVGCGEGGSLLQLIARKPRYIFAFDPQEYPHAWSVLKEFAKKHGVILDFAHGGFEIVPSIKFDFVMSDAVFQYIPNIDKFVETMCEFLKKGGVFYSAWGPTYYTNWRDNFAHIFNGEKRWDAGSKAYMEKITTEQIVKRLNENGMRKEKLVAQVSLADTGMFDENLDKYGVPKLDRHCKGFFVWAKKYETQSNS